MIVSHRHKLVFIAVGKTGSKSIFQMLVSDYAARMDRTGYHGIDRETLENEWADYFTFATVRNPYTRMLSLYDYVRRKTTNYMHRHAVHISFLDFVRWHCGKQDPAVPRVLPQHKFLEGVRLDRILRFENLQEEFNALPFIVEKRDLSHKHKGSLRGPWRRHYNAESLRIVTRYALGDFEAYGYKPEIPDHELQKLQRSARRPAPARRKTPPKVRARGGDTKERDAGGVDAGAAPPRAPAGPGQLAAAEAAAEWPSPPEVPAAEKPEGDPGRRRHRGKRNRDGGRKAKDRSSGDQGSD